MLGANPNRSFNSSTCSPSNSLILAEYGYNLRYCYQMEICKYIWGKYEKELKGVKLQNRIKRNMISLVWLTVQDLAAKNRNELYKKYAATALANLLSVHRDTWYQTYATPWKELKKITELLDFDTLNTINLYVSK